MELKCLHIITRLANGGAEETVLELIVELSKINIFCDLAVGKEFIPEVLEKFSLPPQCKIFRIKHLVAQPSPLNEILALREIRKLIRTNKYTIVQTHASKAGILGRIAAHKERVPVIIGMIHGISFPPFLNILSRTLYKNLERYTAKRSTALVSVGEDLKNKYILAKIDKEDKFTVIYTGMDLELFFRHGKASSSREQILQAKKLIGLPEDSFVISSIGRLDDNKNQRALISMLPKILEKIDKAYICLIGDGPNQKKLADLATALNIKERVIFTGYVPKIWQLFPALDIHCMLSFREGLPRVLVQTSAARIANICYVVDGVWEIVEHEKSGFIIPHGDEKSFIEKLVYLAEHEDLRRSFGNYAAKLADNKWSLKKFREDTQKLYISLLEKAEKSKNYS